jgi:phosphoribosylaminoimidazolecarboxamide formyltransferase/IMP cyclohydrolase
MSKELVKVERALISVSDKTGLDKIVKRLDMLGVEIISTGGTKRYIEELGIKVVSITTVTGNPEVFSGRMKSLSFQVSSGLLYQRDVDEDIQDAKRLDIKSIDLVICNLYPFDKQCSEIFDVNKLVELIDVGGPTMIRSGAKNFRWVTVCTDPNQYNDLDHELEQYNGSTSGRYRQGRALEAFRLLSNYDSIINLELSKRLKDDFGLRYGENPHQRGYVVVHQKGTLADVTPIQGKKLSYNNYLDADSAISVARDLIKFSSEKYGVVIIKHQNPCGVAVSNSSLTSLKLSWEGDTISSFGSVIAFTHKIDKKVVNWLKDKFIELIIAPDFSEDALELLKSKKNLRVIKYDFIKNSSASKEFKTIDGGVVVQDKDDTLENDLLCVTKSSLPANLITLARFSILTAKHLKSNAISLVRNSLEGMQLIGAGMGNPNRLVSVEQAISKAKENGVSSFSDILLASDAFFPFPDNIEKIGEAGINFIVQPGGSIKDEAVIAECDKRGIGMVFTKTRHFKH